MILESVLGVATGLIGSCVTAYSNYKQKKMELEDKERDRQFQIKMVEAQTQATIEEAKAQMEIVRTQVQGAVDLEETKAYTASIAGADKSFISSEWLNHLMDGNIAERIIGSMLVVLLGIAEFLKDIMRPTLTTYLMGISTWLTMKAFDVLEKSGIKMSADQATALVNDVTQSIIFLTMSAVTWWFADRQTMKYLQQKLSHK